MERVHPSGPRSATSSTANDLDYMHARFQTVMSGQVVVRFVVPQQAPADARPLQPFGGFRFKLTARRAAWVRSWTPSLSSRIET